MEGLSVIRAIQKTFHPHHMELLWFVCALFHSDPPYRCGIFIFRVVIIPGKVVVLSWISSFVSRAAWCIGNFLYLLDELGIEGNIVLFLPLWNHFSHWDFRIFSLPRCYRWINQGPSSYSNYGLDQACLVSIFVFLILLLQ